METKRIVQLISTAAIVGLFATASWLTQGRAPWNDGCVVWVFDVGQGDSQFIDCPGGQVLIDGGPSSRVVEELTRVMAPWDRSIDIVINTHPHADHVTGLLSVLNRYDVGEVWVSGQQYHSEVFSVFNDRSAFLQREVQSGDAFVLGDNIQLTVLWPESDLSDQYLEDPNEGSIVTLLEVGDQSMLFTGDIGTEQEQLLLDMIDGVDVLKVAHQGSLTSSDPLFLESLGLDMAIVSVGENSYGHPHPVVVDRFKRLNIPLKRTDIDGSVRVPLD